MSRICPTEDELIELLDGELTENRARELRGHVAGCAACQALYADLESLRAAIAAPLPGIPLPGSAERITAAVTAVAREVEERPANVAPLETAREARASRLPRTLAGVAALLAVAAAVFLVLPRTPRGGDFTPRGADAGRSLRRDVGVDVLRAGADRKRLERLDRLSTVTPDTAYAVSYTNLGDGGSAYLMVFAVDSLDHVHWIAPAYLDESSDPSSIRLDHADAPEILPGATVLDSPAEGALRIVTLVTRVKLSVSLVDKLPQDERTDARLRARFHGAEVASFHAELRKAPPGAPSTP